MVKSHFKRLCISCTLPCLAADGQGSHGLCSKILSIPQKEGSLLTYLITYLMKSTVGQSVLLDLPHRFWWTLKTRDVSESQRVTRAGLKCQCFAVRKTYFSNTNGDRND